MDLAFYMYYCKVKGIIKEKNKTDLSKLIRTFSNVISPLKPLIYKI